MWFGDSNFQIAIDTTEKSPYDVREPKRETDSIIRSGAT
jgi:hypothetical protein